MARLHGDSDAAPTFDHVPYHRCAFESAPLEEFQYLSDGILGARGV
jgi:hypothetical protein